MLTQSDPGIFQVDYASQLTQALHALGQHSYDVILLDLSLPDSQGFDTFLNISAQAANIPIVVLTASQDEALGVQAVRAGAQDYLGKDSVGGQSLGRALRYAIERQRKLVQYKRLSMIDELTGLLNRRGFIALGKQHLKIARRSRRNLLLFFVDLDGLKQINDHFGHRQGDQALKTVAAGLRDTFRSSDVIGRIGGDEFTVMAVDASTGAESMLERLKNNISRRSSLHPQFPVSFSVGIARFDPQRNTNLDDLLVEADQDLYARKKAKPSD